MANVQFNAKFGKITLASKNKVELELPEGMKFAKIAEIAAFKGHDVIVQFGNPQVEMEFQQQTGGGLVAKVDGSGVVEDVQREEQESEQPADEGLSEEEELDFGSDEGEEASEEETEPGDGDESEGSEDESGEAAEADQEEETEADSTEVSKGELEEFIIDVRPAFTDIPYDFPGILEQKRETGCSWIDISRKMNVTSSKLQAAYMVYKKRVKKLIAEQQESNGAA